MAQTIINGEIYIKTKPDIIIPDKKKIKEIEEKLYDISFEEAHNGSTTNTIREKHKLEMLKEELETIRTDYKDMQTFHVLGINENYIGMTCFDRLGEKKERAYQNIGQINKTYIRLCDFINEAEYIGKTFKRTKPISENNIQDSSYMTTTDDFSIKVLYKTDEVMLIEYSYNFYKKKISELEIMEKKYFIDNNYEFIGEKDNRYINKKELYLKLLDQFNQRYELYKKYKKRKQK